MNTADLAAVVERLDRIESALKELLNKESPREWYSTADVAKILGKAEFTVREWCRLGRVNASKRDCGRGLSHEWMVSHAELRRIQNEGLLPQPKFDALRRGSV